ncbi:tetratricopeptide repeat protein [Pleurocapsa sp. FMAR1]|uniref:tetratricopeptide repeat protein n=1 Tax=Pleurocapsa sp. FMAR1 TaxID=3040204 RepID=UPI0029C97B23|nr:tetratricopeptide repeat protein [Pleurocapsa sp. FMAR1]
MSKRKGDKNKTFMRVVTLVLGLGFAGSTLALTLASVFSQNNSTASNPQNTEDPALAEKQMQMQIEGYKKVLEREPKNVTALQGLAQIYMQTDPKKAIPTLEKLAKYYPEQKEYAGILQIIKQQEGSQPAKTEKKQAPTKEAK